ncbi:tRNA-binding protein [Streptomyces sp. APSN-46.1]|uniref:tRNA-binding protein n=1 Tax=Streptomyces sp. APSN-46.1 TaxID=2929049 RepID=UPI001FB3CA4A|nr:tRNA-binding protein [Streptomyces sp. APSN-46.1]MCJ1681161.1 tRNA-binding protein [Streptomyces sp. APSN-46.1]
MTDRQEPKAQVDAAHFFAADIRVGLVLSVDSFPEARKPAYKLRVDFGPLVGELATSAQVANYPAGELAGRLVVGVVNLGKKRIAGFTSECLLLGSYDTEGVVQLLSPAPESSPGDVVG